VESNGDASEVCFTSGVPSEGLTGGFDLRVYHANGPSNWYTMK
jgi:hypothetical protein